MSSHLLLEIKPKNIVQQVKFQSIDTKAHHDKSFSVFSSTGFLRHHSVTSPLRLWPPFSSLNVVTYVERFAY